MNQKNNIVIIAYLALTISSTGFSQYFGEQVMEKSFEQTDFFFTPYRLIPFGIGTFKHSVSGVLDDPLLNLDVNPAYLYRDSIRPSFGYLDFRSAREIRESRAIYFPYPILADRSTDVSVFIPYPRFYINTRRELEPVVSAAYLLRPTEGLLRNLSLGVTYQLVSQDDKYYPIPQDIYKSVLGSNYLGVRSDAATNIPIVDKFSGRDDIHQEGHFASLFAGYEVDPTLHVGAKVARVTFDREGSYGSQNLWEYYYNTNSTSLWRNLEARTQSYRHWELIGGINYAFDQKYQLGFSGGYLWGDADQLLTRDDSSYYGYGPIGSLTDNWSVYAKSGMQSQSWIHDGKTALAGVDLRARATSTQLFQFHYQYARQNTDITLDGLILDTSYGMSRYRWDTTEYNYRSTYRLFDHRDGTGTTVGNTHRAVGSLQWEINSKVRLYLGVQYESRIVETNTQEAVFADRHSRYSNTGSYPYNYFDSTDESKTLFWNFRSRLSRFTIPVFFTIKTSDVVEFMFGFNRSSSSWCADDVTLAIFDYRVQANLQDTSRRENFGERYTLPTERVSDIRTTLLAGLTISPSSVFNIRFLVIPNFVETYEGSELSDLQWWTSINVLP
ncbi:MAG: hypothetical protein HY707_07520 [Ignavibacteriae bacterium]|nr:hypothetical protein [Ignavibacteriota bacterium]